MRLAAKQSNKFRRLHLPSRCCDAFFLVCVIEKISFFFFLVGLVFGFLLHNDLYTGVGAQLVTSTRLVSVRASKTGTFFGQGASGLSNWHALL